MINSKYTIKISDAFALFALLSISFLNSSYNIRYILMIITAIWLFLMYGKKRNIPKIKGIYSYIPILIVMLGGCSLLNSGYWSTGYLRYGLLLYETVLAYFIYFNISDFKRIFYRYFVALIWINLFLMIFMREHLIHSLKVKYEEKQKEDYLSKLMEIRMSEQIVPRMDSLEEAVIKQKATDENLELLLTQIVTERKQKVDITTAQVMITLESLCHEVRKQYLFDGESDFKKKITDLLLIMTENSRLGNEIYVDDNAEILYRGFRAGENCEVLMRWGIEWLYPYILAFYEKVGIWEFHDRYDVFFGMLEQEFRKNGYIGTLISESAFSL